MRCKKLVIWLKFSIIWVVLLGCSMSLSGCDHREVTYLPVPTVSSRVVEEFPVCLHPATQWHPALSGNIVVWVDYRNEKDVIGEAIGNGDVYGYDLSMGEEFMIAGESWQEGDIAISGNTIVWLSEPEEGSPSIKGYDLTEEEEFLVYQGYDCDGWGGQPGISENLVVFRRGSYGEWDIWGYDLSTGTEFPICTKPFAQVSPAICGNIVVWQDFRHGNWDIYGFDLSTGTKFPICINVK